MTNYLTFRKISANPGKFEKKRAGYRTLLARRNESRWDVRAKGSLSLFA
jgi:hypothetical protein